MKLFWIVAFSLSTSLLANELAITAADLIDSAPKGVDENSSNIVLGMGPAIVLGEQKTRPGFALELSGKISSQMPLYAGMEWGSFFETSDDFTAIFTLLPSLSYSIDATESIHPMLGVAAGPVLSTGSEDDVRLGALLKPGVLFEVSDAISIHFQTKFGLVGPNFVFIPTLGTAFII